MTFAAFKEVLAAITQGDSIPPADAPLKLLIGSVIAEITAFAPPLKLVTSDYRELRGKPPLMALDSDLYARQPALDTDEIDLDDELIPALAHYIASKLARSSFGQNPRAWHKKEGARLINAYLWRKRESEQTALRAC